MWENSERRQLERQRRSEGRLPPGQSLTLKWPVLQYGGVPRFDPAAWDFRITGLVEKPLRLSWEEFRRLPQTEVVADMHCVTRWSRFDNRWKGVLFAEVMKLVEAKPEARFALLHDGQNYTTNVPLADLSRPNVLFALEHDGEPLAAEHGGPVRLVVPHRMHGKASSGCAGSSCSPKTNPASGSRTATTSTATPSKSRGIRAKSV